jgi:hypothetical protein
VDVGAGERHKENLYELREGLHGLMTFGLHKRTFPAGPEKFSERPNVDGGWYVSLGNGLFKTVSHALFPAK